MKRNEKVKAEEYEDFFLTRVVSRDIIRDNFQSIRNFFGLRLRSYENMINKASKDLLQEAKIFYDLKWYKFIVNPLGNEPGTVIVVLYGRGKFKKEINQLLQEAAEIK